MSASLAQAPLPPSQALLRGTRPRAFSFLSLLWCLDQGVRVLCAEDDHSHRRVSKWIIPLGRQEREYRKRYNTNPRVEIYGLIKASSEPNSLARVLGPKDPAVGPGVPWADLWKRVNIALMQKQLPYPVLPVYLEVMENPDDPLLAAKIVKEGSAGRNDVLALTGQKQVENFGLNSPDLAYPLPHFDTTPPPDIHLGYVYEWAFMALLTIGIGIIAQLKRGGVAPPRPTPSTTNNSTPSTPN